MLTTPFPVPHVAALRPRTFADDAEALIALAEHLTCERGGLDPSATHYGGMDPKRNRAAALLGAAYAAALEARDEGAMQLVVPSVSREPIRPHATFAEAVEAWEEAWPMVEDTRDGTASHDDLHDALDGLTDTVSDATAGLMAEATT